MIVFLLDVDNTLVDNDGAKAHLDDAVRRLLPPELADRFWALYEQVRRDEDVVDFPATLARFRESFPGDPRDDELDRIVNDVPYERCVYPGALEAVAALWPRGTPVVLSDGDLAFQPRKIARAGITAAVSGNVLVFEHKERHLDEIAERYPAERYVLVEDKADVLARVKDRWGTRVTTVHVRQGKYAALPLPAGAAPPDRSVERIGLLGNVVPDLRVR